MRSVWKYVLEIIDGPQRREIPYVGGPVPAHVHEQRGEVCVWAEVDTELTPMPYEFYVIGTGHPAPEGADYIGTAHTHGGQLIWHIFVGRIF